jgi:hypothetical protein
MVESFNKVRKLRTQKQAISERRRIELIPSESSSEFIVQERRRIIEEKGIAVNLYVVFTWKSQNKDRTTRAKVLDILSNGRLYCRIGKRVKEVDPRDVSEVEVE